MKKCAVIILNWNGLGLLKEFLPAASRHTVSDVADLIVADNASLLSFRENYGFAKGYNKAIAECRDYPLVLLLNSDVEVTPGWLTPLMAYMEEHPECGALQPKIRRHRHKEMFEYAGAAGGYLDKNGYPYCRGRLFGEIEEDRGQYDTVARVAWASGAALMTRTSLYMETGGLEGRFSALFPPHGGDRPMLPHQRRRI